MSKFNALQEWAENPPGKGIPYGEQFRLDKPKRTVAFVSPQIKKDFEKFIEKLKKEWKHTN